MKNLANTRQTQNSVQSMEDDSDNTSILSLSESEQDEDDDMDIDEGDTIVQTTLFTKLKNLRISNQKNDHHHDTEKYSSFESPKKRMKRQSVSEMRIEKDLEEFNQAKYKAFGCHSMYVIVLRHLSSIF